MTDQLNATAIHYMYRDANNYKQTGYVIVAGYDPALWVRLRATLEEGTYFLTENVRLPSLREVWDTSYEDADHIWHELTELEVSGAEPTDMRSLAELVEEFARQATLGWPEDEAQAALEEFLADTPKGK